LPITTSVISSAPSCRYRAISSRRKRTNYFSFWFCRIHLVQ
jgi:hypothetical protein